MSFIIGYLTFTSAFSNLWRLSSLPFTIVSIVNYGGPLISISHGFKLLSIKTSNPNSSKHYSRLFWPPGIDCIIFIRVSTIIFSISENMFSHFILCHSKYSLSYLRVHFEFAPVDALVYDSLLCLLILLFVRCTYRSAITFKLNFLVLNRTRPSS